MKSLIDVLETIQGYHTKKATIVLVTGVFDLLHKEHLSFLTKAKAEGDVLIVAIESDKRVSQIKGSDRPIFDQETRYKNIKKLKIADLVFVLPEKFSSPRDHEELIKTIRPHILAVSSHTRHLDKKEDILKKYNGRVKIVHQHNPRISTTKLIRKFHEQK